MKTGNWIPIDKRLIALLPHDRPYTDIEAYISLRVDVDNKSMAPVSAYASLWGWSRSKVTAFMKLIEQNPDGTGKGQVRDKKGTSKGHVICFKFNNLHMVESELKASKGQVEDTSIDPNPSILNTEGHEGNSSQNFDHRPLSLCDYIQAHETDKKAADSLAFYLQRYEAERRQPPPRLRAEQWDDALHRIMFAWDIDVGYDENMKMVNHYFTKTFQPGCDYTIWHFLSPGVRENLYHEAVERARKMNDSRAVTTNYTQEEI